MNIVVARDPFYELSGIDAILILHGYRTGSNYLASVFAHNGFGRPIEYFNSVWQSRVKMLSAQELRKSAVDGIVEWAHKDIFAAKLPLGDLLWLTRAVGDLRDPLGSLSRRFRRCCVVMLERNDIFLQAVSFWRAHASGEWYRYRSANARAPAPDYDESGIYDRYMYLAREAALWREILARSGVVAIRLAYEDVVSCPDRLVDTMQAIAERIDPEGARLPRTFSVQSENVKQGDETSQLYKERFICDLLHSFAR